jgi:hypothetical protein
MGSPRTSSSPERLVVGVAGLVIGGRALSQPKIDRSFVMAMDDDPDSATIVRATVDFAHHSGSEWWPKAGSARSGERVEPSAGRSYCDHRENPSTATATGHG